MRLKRLVNDLVDLGALQSGAYRLDLAPIKVGPFVAACLESAKSVATRAGVSLEGGLAPGAPPILHSDEARLRQVVMILLDRAIGSHRLANVTLVARRGPPASSGEEGMCAGDCIELVIGDPAGQATPRASAAPKAGSGSRRSRLSLALASRQCAALGGHLLVEDVGTGAQLYRIRLPLGLPVVERVAEDPAWSPVLPTGV